MKIKSLTIVVGLLTMSLALFGGAEAYAENRSATSLHGDQEYRARCFAKTPSKTVEACRQLAKRWNHDVYMLLALGRQLEKAGRHVEAKTIYSEGLTLHKNNKALLRRQALVISNLQETQHLRRSDEHQSVDIPIKLQRIKCKHLKGTKAVAACRQALRVDPDNPLLHEGLGDALRNGQRLNEAIAAYERGLARDPTNTRIAQKRMALLAMGATSKSADKHKKKKRKTRKKTKKSSKSAAKETYDTNHSEILMTQLKLLNRFRTEGLISQQEYQQRQQQLLDSIFWPANAQQQDKSIPVTSELDVLRGVDLGRFHALVIGNEKYGKFPRLETTVNDAKVIASTLRDDYGFSVKTLINATRYDIFKELSGLRSKLSERDNLLIYYAGHGFLDKETARGYWLPVDAEQDNYANWISTTNVTDALKAMKALHVLVVADSCYAGTLSREAKSWSTQKHRHALIKRLLTKRSRTVLSSGGVEPVLDSGGGNHSVFAKAFLRVLKENQGVLETSRLFAQLRDVVVANADQTPQYTEIRKAGHQGGDFIFVRSKRTGLP